MTRRRATTTLVLVAAGGFGGAVSRYAVSTVMPGLGGTLLVNVTGSLLLGALLHQFITTHHLTPRTRLVAATGFLSSYTTYSTFAVQTATAASPLLVAGNIVGTYALGFGAAAAGRHLADRLRRPRWLD